MEIKILILALLTFCFSCSQKLAERKNCQLNGKVMMANILYPLKTKIVVYQGQKKLAETISNKEGLFEISVSKCNLKKDLTFIIDHQTKPDTIYNTNGYEKILYSCEKNDTIIRKIEKQENRIDLLVKNCELMVIPIEEIDEGH
jgi:hypothetical protein